MWTPLRKEILQICTAFNISEDRFTALPIYEWEKIQDKIFEEFCYTDRVGWIWERLKEETYGAQFQNNYPFDQLLNLVDQKEKVWLFLDETVSERAKYWFYEGYIEDIVSILGETTLSDEVYVASKKYEWLLCINHHDFIVASGKEMIEKLMKLKVTK
jgi:hypothetical protein